VPTSRAAVERFGRLDIMVNNAGIEIRTSILDTSEAHCHAATSVPNGPKSRSASVASIVCPSYDQDVLSRSCEASGKRPAHPALGTV
jgi:NAD(P)-dependent dehydrogenase (short-subunit alcohol dehydrogenase family)